MDLMTMLNNNIVNNGFTKHMPADDFEFPDGPDWRGFLFNYPDPILGVIETIVIDVRDDDFIWYCILFGIARTSTMLRQGVYLFISGLWKGSTLNNYTNILSYQEGFDAS